MNFKREIGRSGWQKKGEIGRRGWKENLEAIGRRGCYEQGDKIGREWASRNREKEDSKRKQGERDAKLKIGRGW